jgi:hypothetical protein
LLDKLKLHRNVVVKLNGRKLDDDFDLSSAARWRRRCGIRPARGRRPD